MTLLDRTTKEFEDLRNPDWRDMVDPYPRRWMVHDGRKLRLTPKQSPHRAIVTVGYLEAPSTLVVDGDSPDTRIPVPHHAHLPYSAAAILLAQAGKGQDLQRSQTMMAIFDSLIHMEKVDVANQPEA